MLLFIHRTGINAAVWYQQVENFTRSDTVNSMDLPGFGLSPPHNAGFDAKKHGGIVLFEIINHAGIDRACLIGQPLGVWSALRAKRLSLGHNAVIGPANPSPTAVAQ